ncbi:hypothetical protein RF11_04162 [Thelohanellus kitauei]|uniref:Uncharacterized protein n=1 Tax=Thelohanellus kitauei TaxID=669202 RepID=A0A0C2J880_THEKT|nr:hypothetical protein RF11_04162 [Thelohanellus kitauei]
MVLKTFTVKLDSLSHAWFGYFGVGWNAMRVDSGGERVELNNIWKLPGNSDQNWQVDLQKPGSYLNEGLFVIGNNQGCYLKMLSQNVVMAQTQQKPLWYSSPSGQSHEGQCLASESLALLESMCADGCLSGKRP